MQFNDNSLKPMVKRRRQEKKVASTCLKPSKKEPTRQKKALCLENAKCSTGALQVDASLFGDFEQSLSRPVRDNELHEAASEYVRSIVTEDMKKLPENRASWYESVRSLLLQSEPNEILSLPDRISSMSMIEGFEVMPVTYEKSHIWLCLQWLIDGAETPFLSRECASNPCMGKYICHAGSGEKKEGFKLPEMVPLRTINAYREHIAMGYSAHEWKEFLVQKRKSHYKCVLQYPIGSDLWAAPSCVLCRMQRMTSFALNPLNTRKSVPLGEYQQFFMYQFQGMLPQFMFQSHELNVDIEVEESHVLLPPMAVPFISNIIQAVRAVNDWTGIDVNRLYEDNK